MSEVRLEQEPLVATAEDLSVQAACMGAAACSRICDYIKNDAFREDFDDGLPFEQSCYVFDDLSTLSDREQIEIGRAVMIPNVVGIESGRVITEIQSAIEDLQEEQAAFDDYLKAIFCKAPRYIIDEKYDAFEASGLTQITDVTAETNEEKEGLKLIRSHARAFYDLNNLKEDGILYDENSRGIMEKATRNIALGHHVALSGEPGIAKTTLAKHLARLNSSAHKNNITVGTDPIVLSFSSTSEAESHLVEQTFSDGTLGKELSDIAIAMELGIGIVADEWNGMSADQSIRLNDLLLKEPGDIVKVAGREITVAKGYSVIATLNPMTDTQGNRRHGRQQQDSAGAARFERIDVLLPGAPGNEGKSAKETIHRLFMASWVDNYGWQMPNVAQLELADDVSGYITSLTEKATKPEEDGTGIGGRLKSIPLIAQCISPRDLNRLLNAAMAHSDISEAEVAVRSAITEKTAHILSSNNGHIVSSDAKNKVNEALRHHSMSEV